MTSCRPVRRGSSSSSCAAAPRRLHRRPRPPREPPAPPLLRCERTGGVALSLRRASAHACARASFARARLASCRSSGSPPVVATLCPPQTSTNAWRPRGGRARWTCTRVRAGCCRSSGGGRGRWATAWGTWRRLGAHRSAIRGGSRSSDPRAARPFVGGSTWRAWTPSTPRPHIPSWAGLQPRPVSLTESMASLPIPTLPLEKLRTMM
mmetsp:Transcript_41894/g.104134  ORF Transcript_41894/g.104134 Transcript_41894/m.104134 type:complete len:208 (+) Transcript_41894:97-720(+)